MEHTPVTYISLSSNGLEFLDIDRPIRLLSYSATSGEKWIDNIDA